MKDFQKASTIEALVSATKELEAAKSKLLNAVKAAEEDNSRANKKAVRRLDEYVGRIEAKIGHIEVDLAYQTEKHNAILRKPQIGEVIARPVVIEKEVKKVVEKITNEPTQAKSMANAMEEYERQCVWQQEKADKAEAKRIKREAKKAAAEELRKLKAIAADLKKEAEKAEKAQKKADKLEAERTVALGVLPEEAKAMVEKLSQYNTLISTVADEVREMLDRKDVLRDEARALKAEIEELSAGLKRPMCSAKVRTAMAKKAEIEQKISALTKQTGILRDKGAVLVGERKALKKQIRTLKVYGNAAVRPTVRAAIADAKRAEKVKKLDETIRELQTIEERCKKDRFQIPSFDKDTLLDSNGLRALFNDLNMYKASMKNGPESERAFNKSKAALLTLSGMVKKKKPLILHMKDSRPSAIQQNMLSMCMRIDTEDKGIRNEWISVEHGFFTQMKPSWRLFSGNKGEGQKLASKFVDAVATLLDNIVVYGWNNEETKYNGLYSSASHQKQEKVISCKEVLMQLHERLVWFGKTKADVLATNITGAQIWKMRANLARPIAFAITTKDGKPMYLHNVHMVPDRKKNYKVKNGLFIGGDHNGKRYEYKDGVVPTILGDGAILALEEMCRDAFQGGGTGLKGMFVFAEDARDVAEAKRGIKADIPEDKYFVCGDGCFKFDKLYKNWDEFAAVMDELAETYPGINRIYALRESEEVEDDEKIRKISRSLVQQLIVAGDDELEQLAQPTVESLLYKKTFEGLYSNLAELGLPEEKRTALGRLFFECPELLTNAIVQFIGMKSWEKKQWDAIGNKLRTKGQYPYIMQDPVALIEVWLLGADPDDPTLGVLKEGEASVVGVKEGTEMVAIRYPANFFTAKIVVCKPLKEIFGRCGNVAIFSIHDDILIVQDGDVDGDEAGLFYDELLIRLVKRMRAVVKPPVVVFEHGDKHDFGTIGTEHELVFRMYASLHSAKENDSVGKFANLARDCAYLACVALREGVKAKREGRTADATAWDAKYRDYVLWMAAASTGAILAIDQVKGNDIDEALIRWLDKIQENMAKLMSKPVRVIENGEEKTKMVTASPWTQPYVKADETIECLPVNMQVCTDILGYNTYSKTGNWEFDAQGFTDNKAALAALITDTRFAPTAVRSAPVLSGMLTELRANYFNRNFRNDDGSVVDPDAKIKKLIDKKLPVGQKDILLMYYRNMNTLEFRMQEKTVPGKRAAYFAMVRKCLFDQALSIEWKTSEDVDVPGYERGHVFTEEEKKAIVVNTAIVDALELGKNGNGVEVCNKPSYAKFVMNVFAEDVLANVRRNRQNADIRRFMMEDIDKIPVADAQYEETDFSLLAEAAASDGWYPELDENNMSAEELDELMAESMWIGSDEMEDIPENIDVFSLPIAG